MGWQKMFEPWILERGRNYWNEGCVENLSQDGNTVTAVVCGTEDYDVEIEMRRGGNIACMSCTCPYAAEGSFRRLSQYADILCQWSPELVRNTYARMLDGVMSRSSDRNMYRETISYLQRVRRFPNGEEAVKRLADSWRVQFGRRKAMLDELRKAGY